MEIFSARGAIAARAEKISCNQKEISARAEKQEMIWLPDSPETLRAKFIFGAETNISARAEVRHVIATKFQPG